MIFTLEDASTARSPLTFCLYEKFTVLFKILGARAGDLEMPQIGRRYECTTCGTNVLCIAIGDGTIECCDSPVTELVMEDVPSGD